MVFHFQGALYKHQMINLNEKVIVNESNSSEGDHYVFYCKKGRNLVVEDTHNVTTNILGDDKYPSPSP